MPSKTSPLIPKSFNKIEFIEGISVSITHCGLKKNNKEDLVLIKLEKPGQIFGAFTKSKTPGEPVIWNKSIIKFGRVSAILVNSGNANVFNGNSGRNALVKIVEELSKKLKIPEKEIFIASTGVIGEPLDEKKIIKKIPFLLSNLNNTHKSWYSASKAIMTTDTYPKFHSEIIDKNEDLFINGIAKGSGMIAPNMATMLAFIFTNYNFSKRFLKKQFFEVVDKTFNSITVDGDTSTSDMVLFFYVKSKYENKILERNKNKFILGLEKTMEKLSEYIVKDGEGATKFIKINITGAKSIKDARKIGCSIANSPLFKTAMAGSDANWGRIVMAIGKSDSEINPKKISIKFGRYLILDKGKDLITENIKFINRYLKEKELEISIDVGLGNSSWIVKTCDFTKNYISINTDYRS